jgi:hypothetical protein
MKKFILTSLYAILPLIILTLIYLIIDPYKVIFNYSDYYLNKNFVSLNRSVVNTRLYKYNRAKFKYNSFIFGNSRSLAFKIKDWKNYLDENDIAFHFDGNAEGIYGILAKMKYIDSHHDKIKNALIILDASLLEITSNRDEPLFSNPPESCEINFFEFHFMFFKNFLNPKFFIGFFDYSLFGKYRKYMGGKFLNFKYPNYYDSISSDIYLGLEQDIKHDSIFYYQNLTNKLMKINLDTIKMNLNIKPKNLQETKIILEEIKLLLVKNKTKYKVIINPNIIKSEINKYYQELLLDIFGNNLYDFTGNNEFSNDISNFYDLSHYRPKVAQEILRLIYTNNLKTL